MKGFARCLTYECPKLLCPKKHIDSEVLLTTPAISCKMMHLYLMSSIIAIKLYCLGRYFFHEKSQTAHTMQMFRHLPNA